MRRYAARRLPVHRGPAAWSAILGPQTPAEPLEGNRTADFVIVGAGFAGLSAARRLTQLQPGSEIIVLEAGMLAEGSSGRNSGFMIDMPHNLASKNYAGAKDDRALIALNRQAIAFARQNVEDFGIDRNYFDPVGKVNGAAGPAAHRGNQFYARHLESLGEPHEQLDAGQMRELTGSSYYVSGLYTPGTVMLQPAGYIRGLGDALRQTVRIHERSPVTGFNRLGTGWQVQTERGTVATDRVILTSNGHLESFGIECGRLMQLFLYAAMTPALTGEQLARLGGRPRWGITPSDPTGTTMRRIDAGQGGNRIITRTCTSLRSDMTPSQAGLNRAARVMQRKFDRRFPKLAGMAMEYRWAGHLCLSRNGVAVMREIDTGVFSGCVQNGLGTARGTLTGIGAAELACGEASDITRYFTAQPRPSRLPPRPLRDLGANAVLRWKEWQARDE